METINIDDITIKIELDTEPINPREWDNLGTMYCFHRNYILGDKKPDYMTGENCQPMLWANYGTDKEKREIILNHLSKQESLEDKKIPSI